MAAHVSQAFYQEHRAHVSLGGVLRLHSDIDVSVLTKELRQYIKTEGIILVPAAPYESSGHGFVERPHSDSIAERALKLNESSYSKPVVQLALLEPTKLLGYDHFPTITSMSAQTGVQRKQR
jgi:hypothetical protein